MDTLTNTSSDPIRLPGGDVLMPGRVVAVDRRTVLVLKASPFIAAHMAAGRLVMGTKTMEAPAADEPVQGKGRRGGGAA